MQCILARVRVCVICMLNSNAKGFCNETDFLFLSKIDNAVLNSIEVAWYLLWDILQHNDCDKSVLHLQGFGKLL